MTDQLPEWAKRAAVAAATKPDQPATPVAPRTGPHTAQHIADFLAGYFSGADEPDVSLVAEWLRSWRHDLRAEAAALVTEHHPECPCSCEVKDAEPYRRVVEAARAFVTAFDKTDDPGWIEPEANDRYDELHDALAALPVVVKDEAER